MAQPKGKSYEKEVLVPKVWEKITLDDDFFDNVLVSKDVSKYIRRLEARIKDLQEEDTTSREEIIESIKKAMEDGISLADFRDSWR